MNKNIMSEVDSNYKKYRVIVLILNVISAISLIITLKHYVIIKSYSMKFIDSEVDLLNIVNKMSYHNAVFITFSLITTLTIISSVFIYLKSLKYNH